MIKIGITLEGSAGLTWPIWQQFGRLAEEAGFYGLYRSDHLTGLHPPDQAALELWISLTWLASHTRRIEFGPLVSPLSFRHPVLTAKMAGAVDDLSGGRLLLGLGAGGWEREHAMFGLDLLPLPQRLERFAEGVEVIHRLLTSDQPVRFDGHHFTLREAALLPRPQRPGGPPLLIGGLGKQHTLPLAARFAGEWNGVYLTPDGFQAYNRLLDAHLARAGRDPRRVTRSVLTACIFGETAAEVAEKARRWLPAGLSEDQRRAVIAGNAGEIVEQIGALQAAGVEKLMLVWFDLQDRAGLERLASQALPHFAGSLPGRDERN